MRTIVGLAFTAVGFAYLGAIVMDWSQTWQIVVFLIAILICVGVGVGSALRDD
jgi:hypothetical protein